MRKVILVSIISVLLALHFSTNLLSSQWHLDDSIEQFLLPVSSNNYHWLPKVDWNVTSTTNKSDRVSRERRVIHWDGVGNMSQVLGRFWKGNPFCEMMQQEPADERPVHLNVTFSCQAMFDSGVCGTGNFLSLFYDIRASARLYNATVSFHCDDAIHTQTSLILPWFMGDFADPPLAPAQAHGTCMEYALSQSVAYMLEQIKLELRKMAVALVGTPRHEATEWVQKYSSQLNHLQLPMPTQPLVPDFELDETVVHFRCGDLMSVSHRSFVFVKFHDLVRHIPNHTRSIGIVTQPFDKDAQQRKVDQGIKVYRCLIVVQALVQYIEHRFPQARVKLRNDRNETIAITYARMVMANQTITSFTSFGVFPALANFGTGYVRVPNKRAYPNQFLNHPLVRNQTNVVLYNTKYVMPTRRIKNMWASDPNGTSVLEWFQNPDIR